MKQPHPSRCVSYSSESFMHYYIDAELLTKEEAANIRCYANSEVYKGYSSIVNENYQYFYCLLRTGKMNIIKEFFSVFPVNGSGYLSAFKCSLFIAAVESGNYAAVKFVHGLYRDHKVSLSEALLYFDSYLFQMASKSGSYKMIKLVANIYRSECIPLNKAIVSNEGLALNFVENSCDRKTRAFVSRLFAEECLCNSETNDFRIHFSDLRTVEGFSVSNYIDALRSALIKGDEKSMKLILIESEEKGIWFRDFCEHIDASSIILLIQH